MIFSREVPNVLVETSETTRRLMSLKAKSLGLNLIVFGIAEDFEPYVDIPHTFLKNLDRYLPESQFYFGYRFGPHSKLTGVDLARAVKSRFFDAKTYLVTRYSKDDFQKELRTGVLDGVYPKVSILHVPYEWANLTTQEQKEFTALQKGELFGGVEQFTRSEKQRQSAFPLRRDQSGGLRRFFGKLFSSNQ